ncbi:MAG: carboxypeptidase regulatory-like domain-containing protein [Bdellovibrionaceae bacterium]|nr:carboxypeptidase regulatory-like domain-containing protein [Pseudobdellovibrionaceae bacterium]
MPRKYYLLFLLLFSTSVFAKNHLVELRALNAELLADYLTEQGYDIPGHVEATGKVDVVTENPKALEQLAVTLSNDAKLNFEIRGVTPTAPYRKFAGTGVADFLESYYDREESLNVLKGLERDYPDYARVYNLNEWLGLPKTPDGNALYALQVSERPGVVEDEPKMLVIGQHHAREVTTHHIVLDSATALLKSVAAGEESAKKFVKDSSIWFVPVVNPDGLQHVFEVDRMWRKNRARNSDGSRGVDLNRNYAFKWGACGMNSPIGASEVFKGPSAQSEVEVQVMDKLNAKLRAQYVLSFHSYGNEVLYPYLCGDMAESEIYYGLRDRLADKLGYGMRVGSASGEDFEQHYARYGSLAFLIEVGTTFQPSFETYKQTIWPTIGKAVPFILSEMHSAFVQLQVVDSATGSPLEAKLSLEEIEFKEGESRSTDAFGSYRWRLSPGTYSLSVEREGYRTKTVPVVASGRIDKLRIELEKSGS